MTIKKSNMFENFIDAEVLLPVKKLNGYVMHENTIVAEVTDDNCNIINVDLCPIFILRTKNVRGWIESRSIDMHRTNSRLLRKTIRLYENKSLPNELETALYSKCVTITDNYWFKEKGSNDKFEDVRLLSDKLADLALTGRFKELNRIDFMTPELTNIGSFEKCWRHVNGDWYMYKASEDKEKFSEIFISKLGETLDLDMAEYIEDINYPNVVVSRDFTNNAEVDFEPMVSIIGDKSDDFEYNIKMLRELPTIGIDNEVLVNQYLDILFMDAICFNLDRHEYNYGILRDSKTGLVCSMAPNFDNNLALISRDYNVNKYKASSVFLDSYVDIFNYCPDYTIPEVDKATIISIADIVNEDCNTNYDSEYIASFVNNNYEYIMCRINNDIRYT